MSFRPQYNSVDPTLENGQFNAGRVDVNGRLLTSASGGSTAITSVTPGTTATSLGKAEDAAHASGDVGVMLLGVRNDTGVVFGADGDYSPLSVDSAGNLKVASTGSTISTANSTTANLGISAVFTGTSVSVIGYGAIIVNIFASHASATNGLSIQQSSDGTNWDITDTYTISATTATKVVIPRQAAFARVVYTNGGTLTTSLRLQTILNTAMPVASAQKPADAMSVENDFAQYLGIHQVYNGTTVDLMRSMANSANTTGTGILATGLMAQFDDVSPTAITENSFGNLRMSADHVLYTTNAPTTAVGTGIVPISTSVAAGSLVIKGTPGNLYSLNVNLPTGAIAQKLMLFNATSAPADGTVTPLKVWDVPAAGAFDVQFSPPIRCATGITAVLSTTGPFTKTIALTTNLGFISANFL